MKVQTLCSFSEFKEQSEDKPDMIEVNTSYLWQTLTIVDAKIRCASAQISSTDNILADMSVSTPVSTFFISANTSLLQISA